MNKQPFILDFDKHPHAVLEPNHDQEPFHFSSKIALRIRAGKRN